MFLEYIADACSNLVMDNDITGLREQYVMMLEESSSAEAGAVSNKHRLSARRLRDAARMFRYALDLLTPP